MESSKVALVLSLLVCFGWTVLGSSAIDDEDAVPSVPMDGRSMRPVKAREHLNKEFLPFISCGECKKTVELLGENYNTSTTKEDIKKALDGGKLSKKAGNCSSSCRKFVKDNMDDILRGLKKNSLGSICKDKNACAPPMTV